MDNTTLIDWLIKGFTGLLTFMFIRSDKEAKDTRKKMFDYKNKFEIEQAKQRDQINQLNEKIPNEIEKLEIVFELKINNLKDHFSGKFDKLSEQIKHAEKTFQNQSDTIAQLLQEWKK